ncbi:MAG: IlvD/Edd family dehydratase, partial [Propionicimonas sp.]|nr:IlvD/Edd family dehydratase [Propionicimonas sp.]
MATGPGKPSNSNRSGQRRSEWWFNDLVDPAETAIYLERLGAAGITRAELQSGRPIIGITQSGSDIVPCNRIHVELVERSKAGVRDAGGVPLVFPVHPIQETLRRPTAALDRNLLYLGLVELLAGYPFDGVVLTTGCDKTTPSQLMAAASVDLPAITLNGGPMLDGRFEGRRVGAGTALWEARRRLAAGQIDEGELIDVVMAASPSLGHCNTMGTALTMNSLAEALGMALPGSAAIPAPYAARGWAAYETGKRIVGMVEEDLRPSRIMTRQAFENAIVVNSAIGGSTNAPIHLNAIAAHLGVELSVDDWDTLGSEVPLLVDVAPAGRYLAESFHHAAGVPAVMAELRTGGYLHLDVITVTGQPLAAQLDGVRSADTEVIHTVAEPLAPAGGFLVLHGNLFGSGLMKLSVIGEDFRRRYLCDPDDPNAFVVTAVVFEGPEDYRARIDDPGLPVDEHSILVVRGAGPIGYPGSAEVVNMTPPGRLVRAGVSMLPCLGDGRQSGTSDSPSILNISPEAAAGGAIALVTTGDQIRVDLGRRRVELLVSDEELARR